MTPADLIAELPPESCGVATRVLLRYLADHVHYAILTGGLPVRDATDFDLWLRELVDHARLAELKIAEQAQIASSTKVSSAAERSTGPAAQPRWGKPGA